MCNQDFQRDPTRQDIFTKAFADRVLTEVQLKDAIIHEVRILRDVSKVMSRDLQEFSAKTSSHTVTRYEFAEWERKNAEHLTQVHTSEDNIDRLLAELDGLK